MEENRFLKISIGIIILFILGVVLKLAKVILFPFLLAVFISYLLEPILDFLIRRKIPKIAAIAITLLGTFAVLYLSGALLYSSGKTFAEEFPQYERKINDLVLTFEEAISVLPFDSSAESPVGRFDFAEGASFILSALGPFFRFVSRLFLVFLFLVFIFVGRGRLQAKLHTVLSPKRRGQVMVAIRAINHQIRSYLAVKTVMSLLNGFQVWLVLKLFGVDFALLFGFIAFILNYIPNIGSTIAAAFRVGFAFFQFGTIWVPLWILIITVGLDNLVGTFLEPKIMGQKLGMSPLVVLFSLIFWGWLWGISGMILAIPLVAVIKIVCENIPSLRPLAVLME
jgi:predicted PurR-regulated permease PerM